MGRPTSLTPEVERKICASLRAGNYRETAAAAGDVDARSVRRWLERGEQGEEPFAAFLSAVQKAEAAAERRLLRAIRKGVDNWQSKAWIMERRWPAKWGGRVRVTVSEERESLLAKVQRDPELHERLRNVLGEGDPQATPGTPAH